MNKRLVINLITLVITAFLLIFVVRAWYVTNEKASVSGIIGSSDSDDFTLELERGIYNSGSQTKWTWVSTNDLSIQNMQPGDAFFFRFKITASKAGSFRITLSKINSSLQENTFVRLLENTKYYAALNTTKLYEMDSLGSEVEIYSDVNGTTLGTLYNYGPKEEGSEENIFTLDDFLVQDTFKYYDYGIGDTTFFDSQNDKVTDDGTVTTKAKLLNDISIDYEIQSVDESSVWYGYFALEFNEGLSMKSYKHIDGKVKSDSNLFQAQVLNIKEFALTEI